MQEKIINQEEIEKQFLKISNFFDKSLIEKIAKEAKFVERSSKLTGTLFLVVFLLGIELYSKPTLTQLIGLLNIIVPELVISREGLHKRINQEAVDFFEIMLTKLIEIPAEIKLDLLKFFKRIIILDSTIVELPKELVNIFKGSGGKASDSALKIQFYYDLISGKFNFLVQEGVNPDNKYNNNFVDKLEKSDLIIKDLGYFNTEAFIDITGKEAYFLSRWKSNVKLYSENGNELNLLNFVSKVKRIKETNIIIKSSYKSTKSRLVVEKVPKAVEEQRLRNINKKDKQKGRITSKETKELQRYNIYVSNIPEEILPKENFRVFYSLRWQVELVFKNWKSNFNLEKISGIREERVKCLLYSRLILIFMATKLIFIARNYLWINCSEELSDFKASKYLNQVFYECLRAMLENKISKIRKLFLRAIDFLTQHCTKIKQKDRAYPLDIISSLGLG